MKYALEMDSGAIIYTPSLMNITQTMEFLSFKFRHSEAIGLGHTQTHRQHGERLSLL
jgi:hypothetical protein